MNFTRFSKSQLLLKIHFCDQALRKIQYLTNTPLIHGKNPRINWVLQFGPWPWEVAAPAKFRRAGRASGRGNGGARPWAHLGPVGCRCWGGDRAGAGTRREPVAVAGVARLRRRRGLGPNNNWNLRVLKGLWKGCARLLDRGKQGGAQLDGGGTDGGTAGQWRREEGRAALGFYRRGSR
jgi:hypothetical protein